MAALSASRLVCWEMWPMTSTMAVTSSTERVSWARAPLLSSMASPVWAVAASMPPTSSSLWLMECSLCWACSAISAATWCTSLAS
ncbi:hypothetical protein D3C78_1211010 [compost metagenome]